MPVSKHFSGRAVVRWGIIGCGNVTEVKSGPGFQQAANSQLVAVMRRDATLAADYARRHGVPRWYDNADALIHDPQVDAVYVATPPDTHGHYALKAAAAGKPAYVEKPMARHTAECDRMIAAFAQARLPLYVAYYRRGLPRFLTVAELLDGGAIGHLTGVNYRYTAPHQHAGSIWRVDAAIAGGGHFLDVGSHALDLMDFLFGPLEAISGQAANLASPYAVEDAVAMSFRTSAGVPGAATWSFASALREDTLTITGTNGQLSFSVFGNEPLQLQTADGGRSIERPNPVHIQQPLIQTIIDDLLGRDVCASTGESARRTSCVMDTVLATYYGGREDRFWERPQSWPGRRKVPQPGP